jgi:hypothetical protein
MTRRPVEGRWFDEAKEMIEDDELASQARRLRATL